MKAVFVADDHGIRYAEMIVKAYKTIETRRKNMLRLLVGERVAVVRTGNGRKPMIVGYVDIVGGSFCASAEEFEKNFYKHLVPYWSNYYTSANGKWFYHLANAEECTPYPLPENAVRHGRSWCEF